MTISPEEEEKLKHIHEIDQLTLSPEARGLRVLKFLENAKTFTPWDVICLSMYYLCYVAPAMMTTEGGTLSKELKEALSLIDQAIHWNHYFGMDWSQKKE